MDDLIDEITRQVIAKLKDKKSPTTPQNISHSTSSTPSRSTSPVVPSFSPSKGENAVIVLTGGREELDTVLEQISLINKRCNKLTVVMTKSAEKILGIPTVRRAAYNAEIITDWVENVHEILDVTDNIYVPILTLNSAAKVSQLMTDNVALIFMVFGILRGKRVRMATNSVYCCEVARDRSAIPPGATRKIDSMLDQIRDFGVELVDVSELAGSNATRPTSSSSSLVSSTVIPAATQTVCTASSGEECSACGQCAELNPNGIQQLVNSGADRIGAALGTRTSHDVAKMIDHTLLKADATPEQIKKLCDEAKQFEFASVCVNPTNVALAAEFLKGTPVKVCTVIGFPLGATTSTTKGVETRDAIANGAQEIDMVVNVGALKAGDDEKVRQDIETVVEAARGKAIVKVILETALLTKEEIVKGCLLA